MAVRPRRPDQALQSFGNHSGSRYIAMQYRDLVDDLRRLLEGSRVHFGHGLGDARDEAQALAAYVCRAGSWQRASLLHRRVSPAARARARKIALLRVSRRLPLAYLTREAWFAGMRFHVDKRVCIPRSPLAELIEAGFEPWLRRRSVRRVLELCTGSGCIAAACAVAFPASEVVATDISPAALCVAERNMRRFALQRRVALREGDLFAGAEGRFDLLIANPPYVPLGAYEALPREYRHEPRLALTDGANGLAIAERILRSAADYLTDDGLLALELGEVASQFAAANPDLPFTWPTLHRGGEGILLLPATHLL